MQTSEYVERVIDGDTFSTSGQGASVRLEGVNAPERGQAGYQEAKACQSARKMSRLSAWKMSR
ncbi:MAG: hypothetical protein OXK77_10105, partial [Gemmatimonadota bacterium]|nr:hypothetical protein [Gemmatimonadota bacterium]MDE2864004.1 hypothetical protein [Gemmatimonadota bacterium]